MVFTGISWVFRVFTGIFWSDRSSQRYYATYFVLVWSYDALYEEDPVTAFTTWSLLLSWLYAHPMWFFRMVVVVLQKWLLIGDFTSFERNT